ncbi:hypothetical protein M758_UG026900 [Ceratodon purpureus]|nr:hypothetical protein M758_UG026900 [Ceratodon purpureus]
MTALFFFLEFHDSGALFAFVVTRGAMVDLDCMGFCTDEYNLLVTPTNLRTIAAAA